MGLIGILVIGSILSHTISSLIDKKIAAAPKEGSSFSAAMFKMKSNVIVFVPLIFIYWQEIIKGGVSLLIASAVLGLFYGIATEFYFRGLRKGDAGVLFPFGLSMTIIVVYLVSLIIFEEKASLQRFMGVAGVVFGNILLLRSDGTIFTLSGLKNKGIFFFCGFIACATLYQIFSKILVPQNDNGLLLAGTVYIFVILTLSVINAKHMIASKEEYVYAWKLFLKNWRLLFIGSATALVGRWLFFEAFIKGGEATYVMPFFDGGETLTLAVGAILIFKEKISATKIAAVILLSLSVAAISSS